MFSGIKNGKHCTNNINSAILPVIALLSLFLSGPAPSIPVIPANEEWVIVIDPGHGGRDPGAVGSNSFEKNIALAVALRTGGHLEQKIRNVKVVYTRKTDVYVDLNERAEMANKIKADLFISIHANAHNLKSTYGTETYVMGHAKDQQNLEVAMKENEVITLDSNYSTDYEGFDPKSPESYIMFTLMQNAFAEQSTDLAAKIQMQYKDKVKRYDRGVQQGPFWVLWKTTMPSVLTEIGFISNSAEEKYINSRAGQDSIASAIFRACRDYISEINRRSLITTDKPAPQLKTIPVRSTDDTKGKIIFMVQVAASSKKMEIKPANFKNIKEITEIPSNGRYRYAAGRFEDYSKAAEYRKQVEAIYPDAFVIAVQDNKVLPLQEAIDNNKSKSK